MRPEPALDLILAWHRSGPALEQARATLARAMILAGHPPHWREQPGAPPARHLVLTLHGRRLPLPSAPEPLAALLSAPPRPRFRYAVRLLLPAAGYLLLPKCALCWAAWLGLFGLAGAAAGPASLPGATLLLGLVSAAAALAPVRPLLRARRPGLLAVLLGGVALLLGSRLLAYPPAAAVPGGILLAAACLLGLSDGPPEPLRRHREKHAPYPE